MKTSNNARFRSTSLFLCIIMMLCFTISPVAAASAQTTDMSANIDAGYQVATSTDLAMLLKLHRRVIDGAINGCRTIGCRYPRTA